jgi:truncated hemoglobin YjbI
MNTDQFPRCVRGRVVRWKKKMLEAAGSSSSGEKKKKRNRHRKRREKKHIGLFLAAAAAPCLKKAQKKAHSCSISELHAVHTAAFPISQK